MFGCNMCTREYKYKRNLTRHVKENHSKTLEHWNCTEDGCFSKFIRKEYLFRHLSSIHQLSKMDARRKAIEAKKGDIETPENQYYEDVSDDDTILDLLQDLSDVQDIGGDFNIDEFLSSDEGENLIHDENNNMCENLNDCLSSTESVGLMETKMLYEDISSPDSFEHSVENNNTYNEVIVISDEEYRNNSETAVDISHVTTKTQTIVLTFTRTVSYINGDEVFSEVETEQQYSEHYN